MIGEWKTESCQENKKRTDSRTEYTDREEEESRVHLQMQAVSALLQDGRGRMAQPGQEGALRGGRAPAFAGGYGEARRQVVLTVPKRIRPLILAEAERYDKLGAMFRQYPTRRIPAEVIYAPAGRQFALSFAAGTD